MKTIVRRCTRVLLCSLGDLYAILSKPLFFFCFLIAVSPGLMLAFLLGWKALFFPASMPALLWGLFLPAWLICSCGIPALCSAAVLAMPPRFFGHGPCIFVPVCTMQLLLAFLWALMLLYRFPPLCCVLSALLCAISSLLCIGFASRLAAGLGLFMFLGGGWNVLLVFLSTGFY
ncbi:MAG: hypothetical protein E7604_04920 [Ruminococcaceae bacterium]|nr:hypothetical protein [Oscillospiraceae bacterium]